MKLLTRPEELLLLAVWRLQDRAYGTAIRNHLTEVTGEEPKIWGDNFIVGFGKYTYQRKGSKEDHEWFNIGFAPRKKNLTVYLTYDIGQEEELLARLGKCTWGKGCLYINKLADVDLDVLREILTKGKDSGWR